jgi:thymidylate synthase
MIRDNKLHMTVIMRSNDLVFGLPNDIMWFLITQQIIADLLGIETGEYIHIANSLHYYTNLGDYYNKRLNDIITSNDKYENKDVCSHLIKYYSNKFLRAKERLKKENNE